MKSGPVALMLVLTLTAEGVLVAKHEYVLLPEQHQEIPAPNTVNVEQGYLTTTNVSAPVIFLDSSDKPGK